MLLPVLACTSITVVADEDREEGRVEEEGGVEETPGTEDTGDTGERVIPDFFDDSFVHTIDITLSEDAARDLRIDPYTFVPGGITVDGEAFPDVGVRLRGKIGSFRDLWGKPKFKIDFNQYGGERLGDIETLALNNEVVDCSYIKETTGFALFRQLGLPAPRTVYTSVTVNDEDYGLFVALEYPDDRYLARTYAEGTGNLYDGKYLYYDDGSYAFVDFSRDLVGNFTLEEGTDVGLADVGAVTEAASGRGSFAERLGDLVDLEQFHTHLVAEQWVGHIDGYSLNQNNYRVYFDASDGRADFLTYDHDYAFIPARDWGMDWASPRGQLAAECWSDTECLATHAEAVDAALAAVDTELLLSEIDRWTEMIGDAAWDDPRRECSRRDIGPWQEYVRGWMEEMPADIEEYWR